MAAVKLDPFTRVVNVSWVSFDDWVWSPNSLFSPTASSQRIFSTPAGTIEYPTNIGTGEAELATKATRKQFLSNHMLWAFSGPAPTVPQPDRIFYNPGFAVGRYFSANPLVKKVTAVYSDGTDIIFTFVITRPLTKEKLAASNAFDFVAG